MPNCKFCLDYVIYQSPYCEETFGIVCATCVRAMPNGAELDLNKHFNMDCHRRHTSEETEAKHRQVQVQLSARPARLKYPTRIGSILFDANTQVLALQPEDNRIQDRFPGIAAKQGSQQVAIKVPGIDATICSVSQISFE